MPKRLISHSHSSQPVKPGGWRKVLETEESLNPGAWKNTFVGGSRHLKLDCGHEARTKISQPIPKRMKCKQCVSLEKGMISTQFDTKQKLAREERILGGQLVKTVRRMTDAEVKEWTEFGL